MSTCSGWTKNDFWNAAPYDPQDSPCPYCFNGYMSRQRFNSIERDLYFTNVVQPAYQDKFWQVRQMLTAFNQHMAVVFLMAWVICLDKAMLIWHNQWTCPG